MGGGGGASFFGACAREGGREQDEREMGEESCGFPLPMAKPRVPSGIRGPGGSLLATACCCWCCCSGLTSWLFGGVPTGWLPLRLLP